MSAGAPATATVQMTGITVDFGPVRALDGVDLTLRPGEIHALMGENGAGKSTLINVLAGVVTPASGSIVLEGAPVRFSTAAEAQAASVAAVLQDVPLSQHLSIGENVMLGHEPHGRWGIRWNDLHARAHQMLGELGLGELDTRLPLRTPLPAVRQLVAIARAMATRPRVLLLDEPTRAWTRRRSSSCSCCCAAGPGWRWCSPPTSFLLALMTASRCCGRATPPRSPPTRWARRADRLDDRPTWELRRIGLRSTARIRTAPCSTAPAACAGRRGTDGSDLHRGEVVGSRPARLGSHELARLLAGARPRTPAARSPAIASAPAAALRHHIAMASEDRLGEGRRGAERAREHHPGPASCAGGPGRSPERSGGAGHAYIDELGIRPADPLHPGRAASGGNQQKAAGPLARHPPAPGGADEPTKGVDILRVEIQSLIARLAASHVGVVIISST